MVSAGSRLFRRSVWLLPVLGLAACTSLQNLENEVGSAAAAGKSPAEEGVSSYLFQAENTIQDGWFHMRMRGQTDYQLTIFDESVAIRARGQDSASGLIRSVDIDPAACPEIEWAWAVTKLQQKADLHEKQGEDVAASLFLMFGDPGLYSDPDPVPTLRYVWTTDHVEQDEVIDNPYLSGFVKSIVVHVTPQYNALEASSKTWSVEHRNIYEDFLLAFGYPPVDRLQAIAIFSDNDQTHEPVEAFYGWAQVNCFVDSDSDW